MPILQRKRTSRLLLTLLTCGLLSTAGSCNRVVPAGFWKGFKREYRKENISDQGPWGGHRAMYWKASEPQTFLSPAVISFAEKNGWTFVDSAVFDSTQTNKWMDSGDAIFPLAHTGFNGSAEIVSSHEDFPRWFDGTVKTYGFKTGWVAINPGTDDAQEVNGFVLLNSDGSKMAVYHLWGE